MDWAGDSMTVQTSQGPGLRLHLLHLVDLILLVLAQSQTGPCPLALSTHPLCVRPRGGFVTLRAVPNQVVLSVSGLLKPWAASLHRCRLMAVLAGSATGKWTRKRHTNEGSVSLRCPVDYFTRKFVTLTNQITKSVEIQICCSSDRQLI